MAASRRQNIDIQQSPLDEARPGATKSHMTDKKKRILGDYSKFY